MKQFILAALFLTGISFGQVNWKMDRSHSSIGFTVTHMVISEVSGNFRDFEGSVSSKADNDFTNAVIQFTAKTGSINTDNEGRDKHLRSDDFFNADKFPEMKFKGKTMRKLEGNEYEVKGDLTIRDRTEEVILKAKYNGTISAWGDTRAGFQLTGEVNRFDFDLKWNTLIEIGAVVGKMVKIVCNVELIKQK